MPKIICKAYGKINLTLDVLGKRPDGYHEILTLFQGISLYDEITLTNESPEAGKIVLTCDLAGLSTGQDNLAYQAAHLLSEKFPQITGLRIEMKKRIPLAAGLAGGSSDAAAGLLGLNRLYQLDLSLEELGKIGASLGSDVPFCLNPLTAIGKGRGELLSEVGYPCPELWLVLCKPSFGVSTKEVYQHLSQVQVTKKPNLEGALTGLQSGNRKLFYASLGNILEDSTFVLYPQLPIWVQEIAALGAKKVMMAGSGPTLMAFMENKTEADQLKSSFEKPNWNVMVVRTITSEDLKGRMIADE